MKMNIPEFLELFIKFKVLPVSLIANVFGDQCKERRIYEHLKDLIQLRLIERVAHPLYPKTYYRATQKLFQDVNEDEQALDSALKTNELFHTMKCNQVAIEMSKYSFVSGIAMESELEHKTIQKFCQNRIPDGIIQITREDQQFEIALEIETSLKSISRIQSLLKSYHDTFQADHFECQGAIIVVNQIEIYNAYLKQYVQLPEDTRKRLKLIEESGLSNLNPKDFGELYQYALQNPQMPTQKIRTVCEGKVDYLSIKSRNRLSGVADKRHMYIPGQEKK